MIPSILPLLLLSFLPYASDACVWRFCSDINGGGPCYDYPVGQYTYYPHQAVYKYYSSAYLVSGTYHGCVALVYHDPNYGGFERMLTHNTPNFHDIRFNDALASVKIVSTTCGAAQFFYNNLPHSYSCNNCPRGTSKAASTCTIGGTCSNSGSECHSCEPGNYSPSAGGGCLACPVGTFQSGYGAHSCQSCPLGTYQDSQSWASCKLCEAGTKGLRSHATSYNDGCGSCPAGTFQRNRGQGHCDNCAPGYVSAGGAAECSICPAGTKAHASAASCDRCPAGSFSQNGQTSCHSCAPGSVSAEGSAECSICPAGTKADANAASCELCPAGSFQSQTGQTTCELCPEGTFQPTDGESSCIPCAAGEVSFPGSTECIPCPEGTFPDETSGSCQPCHDNLIGFEGKCYGTMDFRNCPYNSEVGECEFDSQDESFELLPGCQIAKLTDDVMTNIILPEEHQFGARNISISPATTDSTSFDAYNGWPQNHIGLYSTETSPCDVDNYIANVGSGNGYYIDTGVNGGWCRTIYPENFASIRSQHQAGEWVSHATGVTYLPHEEYRLIFRQTLPYLYQQNEWRKNPYDPSNDNFSILDELEQFRRNDGKFYFRMVWPGDDTVYEWSQTSNPTSEIAAGYEAISVPYTGQYWGGLEPSPYALMDGSINHSNWFYAVGSHSLWESGIPSYAKTNTDTNYPQQSVELYVYTQIPSVCSDAEGKGNDGEVQTKLLYESSMVTAPATCASQTWSRTCSSGTWGAWTSADITYDLYEDYAYSGTSVGGWASYSEAVAGCSADPLCHGFYHAVDTSYQYKGSCGADEPTCCVGTGDELSNGDCKIFGEFSNFNAYVKNEYTQTSCSVQLVTSTSPLESNITFTSSTFNVSNSTMAPSVAPTTKDDGKVLIECKVGNIVPTASPTVNPTVEPTANPTFNPTSNPSEIPSQNPSVQPSFAPSLAPTFTEPSVSPTVAPTTSAPTNGPTAEPTANPTFNPTSNPSAFPTTSNPTVEPSAAPSFTAPSNVPSSTPTTSFPSSTPTTSIPSSNPTTSIPTISPTNPPSAVEVVEVAESKDGGIFLILLFVGVGCTICCVGCVYFKPIFVGKAYSEENGKRTPGQMELGKPVSPSVDINDALDEMWTKPSVEIKIAE